MSDEPRFIIGSRLRERRIARRLTQQDLATACYVDKATISRIERGMHTNNSITLLMRAASALQCSGYYLLGIRDDTGPVFVVSPRQLELLQLFDKLNEVGQNAAIAVMRDTVQLQETFARQKSDS